MNQEQVRNFVRQATAASAKLEGREIPKDYVRSLAVTRLLEKFAEVGHVASR